MANVKVVLSPDPTYLDPKTYDAKSDRKQIYDLVGSGVKKLNTDFLPSATGTGLQLQTTSGVAYLSGRNITDQGTYRIYVAGNSLITATAADPTNPRLDQLILRVMDTAADASGFSEGRLEVITGTPTAGATLVNRNGAANLDAQADLSKSWIRLADVLVPAGATVLNSGNIADRRNQIYSAIQLGDAGTITALPDPLVTPTGYTYFANDDHGGWLYHDNGGTFGVVAPPMVWAGGYATWNATLPAGSARLTTYDNATKTIVVNNNNVVHAAPDVSLWAEPLSARAGWYQYFARHRTTVAGNIGLEVWKGSTGSTKINGQNKAVVLGSDATEKNDSVVLSGVVFLDPGFTVRDSIFLQYWHSAGATDLIEFGMVKTPLVAL